VTNYGKILDQNLSGRMAGSEMQLGLAIGHRQSSRNQLRIFAMFKLIITAAALAALSPAATFAQDAPRQVQVSYSDLDLSTEAGKAQLNRRIETAVRGDCESQGRNDLKSSMAVRSCTDEARAKARSEVQSKIASRTAPTVVATATATH
jgi:UrcA family protein